MKPTQNEQIILAILDKEPSSKAEFDDARTRVCAKLHTTQPPNRDLFLTYQTLVKKKKIPASHLIENFLRKSGVRSLSGIAVVTSLVKPYSCPGKCVYCPTEVRMPKSYIATEPAAARALRLDFSPYEQMRQRILVLERNGHPTDKIEYIIKGGTWNAYPIRYQYWFILESFRAANEVSRKQENKKAPTCCRGPDSDIGARKQLHEESPVEELQAALEKEQTKNEKARHRIIGLTLETRPDAIKAKTIDHMRRMGCTRVELGLQAPDDAILKLIVRGHTVQQFKDAMRILRQAGFKVDLHFMPDLPGTTPAHDVEMYKLLFSDPAFRPDMVKIYPNTVVPSAELYQWFLDGRYTPYGDAALFDALLQMKLATPRYCRISRLIRDIPATEIAAGNIITNLRENLEKELTRRNQHCQCLRCREVGRHMSTKTDVKGKTPPPQLYIDQYDTVGGTEYFLSFEDKKRIAVYGFLRLRIPTNIERTKDEEQLFSLIPEIRDCAFIRELHVYGQLVGIGKDEKNASQHKGLGKKLVIAAEKIIKKSGVKKIVVISGVGVRDYYRKCGYRKQGTYMVKAV